MRAVFLDAGSVKPQELDFSRWQQLTEQWSWHEATAPDEVAGRIAPAQIVVSNKVPLRREALAAAPHLRLICVAATGTNNVDLAAARELGIIVCNVRGYATASVVQHVFSLILALRGHLCDYDRAVRAGEWTRHRHFALLRFPMSELAGASLGIVGYGALGKAVAEVARAFGMEPRIAQLPGRPADHATPRVPFDELLSQVDVLSLHCPLTEQTRNLLDATALAKMRADALLINTARGGIVDEYALAAALRGGQLGGAGVDVLSSEPPPADHPLLAPQIPNLIVTPHIAWACRQARQRLVDGIAANIAAFAAGAPHNVVV